MFLSVVEQEDTVETTGSERGSMARLPLWIIEVREMLDIKDKM